MYIQFCNIVLFSYRRPFKPCIIFSDFNLQCLGSIAYLESSNQMAVIYNTLKWFRMNQWSNTQIIEPWNCTQKYFICYWNNKRRDIKPDRIVRVYALYCDNSVWSRHSTPRLCPTSIQWMLLCVSNEDWLCCYIDDDCISLKYTVQCRTVTNASFLT